eukprot:TRINITY_DN27525_c0_g1_i1.p1 TRINITY_DN27525_c0_g1~~TRINITY_DN27525_c0_g1_i1.p1  ORF type:complete len:242 (-),score=78.24 TRINITY_DN27525_c0_g1_i1:282-1007(-)
MSVGLAVDPRYQVSNIPSAYYVPDYLSEEEQSALLTSIYQTGKWKEVTGRRLQQHGGIPHPKGMVAVRLPEFLARLGQRMAGDGVFDGEPPNHVLVNEYAPGQGIMPHTDGPLYKPHFGIVSLGGTVVMDFYPRAADDSSAAIVESPAMSGALETAEPGGPTREPAFSLVLKPRSLLVVKDELYHSYLHGIAFTDQHVVTERVANLALVEERVGDVLPRSDRRVSLTIRVVNKVLKNTLRL